MAGEVEEDEELAEPNFEELEEDSQEEEEESN